MWYNIKNKICWGVYMLFVIELFFAKIIAKLVDLIDSKRGTSFIGRNILKIDKNFVSKFKGIDKDKVVLITGTNGKSSTTNLLTHIFEDAGEKVIANLAGANLRSGIATCFVKNSRFSGKMKDGYIILEVDERTLKYILDWVPAGHLVVTNIQTDQVARNGYPEYIYNMLADHIPRDITLYLNSDEPRSKSFEDLADRVIYYGVERMPTAFSREDEFDVTQPCPKCHSKIKFDYMNVSNLGKFHCSACDFCSETTPDYQVTGVDFRGMSASIDDQLFHMPYKAPFMVYNYAAGVAVAKNMGLDMEKIICAFDNFKNIEGRIETVDFAGKTLRYMRTKQENPDTLQSALDAIAADRGKKVVAMGLCTIDDWVPFYSNTFYSYDCDFSGLVEADVEKFICFDPVTCHDIANRLIFAGCPEEKIEIISTVDPEKLLSRIAEFDSENVYLITLLKIFHEIKEAAELANRERGNRNDR